MNHSKLYIIVLVCLVFDVYANVLDGQFVYDDYYYVRDNPGVHTLSNFTDFFTDTSRAANQELREDVYRPLTIISFALTYKLFGLDTLPYHLINIILHALNAVLVFYLARRIISSPSPLPSPTRGEGDSIPSPLMGEGEGEGDHGIASPAARNDTMAFFIAAIFAVHPVQTEAVSWISSRGNVLYVCFLLISFILYLRYSENEIRNTKSEIRNKSEARNPKFETNPKHETFRVSNFGHSNLFRISIFEFRIFIVYLASLLFYILSIFSKESGVVLPALILAYYVFVPNPPSPRPSPTLRLRSGQARGEGERSIPSPLMGEGEGEGGLFKHFMRLIPFFAIGVAFLVLRAVLLGEWGQLPVKFPSATNHLLTVIWTLATYIKLAVFPWRLTVEYMLPNAQQLYGPWSGIAASVIILVVYFTWRLRKTSYLYPLGALWFLIGLLPVLNIVPIRAFVYERFLYLSVIGFAIILVRGVFDISFFLKRVFSKSLPLCKGELEGVDLPSLPLPLRRCSGQAYKGRGYIPFAIVFLIVIIGLYCARTVIRNRNWAGPIPLWSSVLREDPKSPTAKYNLGVEYYNVGDMAKAVEYYLAASDNYGSSGMFARINLAQIMKDAGRIDMAMAVNEDTMKVFPKKSPAYVNQSWIYMKMGDYKKAEELLTMALKIEPDSYYVNQALAELYENTGRPELADKYREVTKTLSPNFGITGEREP